MKKSFILAGLAATTMTFGSFAGVMPAQAATETLQDKVCKVLPEKIVKSKARIDLAKINRDKAQIDAAEALVAMTGDMVEVGKAVQEVVKLDDPAKNATENDKKLAEQALTAASKNFIDDATDWSKARSELEPATVEFELATLGGSFFDGLQTKCPPKP